MVLTAKDGRVTLRRGSAKPQRLPDGDPLEALRGLLGEFQPVAVPGLPRFQGGAVGYLAYDMVRHMERLPRTTHDDLGLPDAVFMLSDTLLVFDNLRHRLLVIANAHVDKRDAAALDRAYDDAAVRIGMTLAKLARPARAAAAPLLTAAGTAARAGRGGLHLDDGRGRVLRCRPARQGVHRGRRRLSDRAVAPPRLPRWRPIPFTVYRALRTINPSPYLFYPASRQDDDRRLLARGPGARRG